MIHGDRYLAFDFPLQVGTSALSTQLKASPTQLSAAIGNGTELKILATLIWRYIDL